MNLPATCDVAVVGCGIFGLSTAAFSAFRGRSVVAFDRAGIGSGTSGRSGAIVRSWYGNEVLARGSDQCRRDYWEILGEVLELPRLTPSFYHRRGLLAIVPADDVIGAHWGEWGLDIEAVPPQSLVRDFPWLRRIGGHEMAWWEEAAGHVESAVVLATLRDVILRDGGVIAEHCPVLSLDETAGGTWRIVSSAGVVSAGAVVLAPGPWAASVGRLAGLDVPVRPTRVQVLVVDRRLRLPGDLPCVIDLGADFYTRPVLGSFSHVGFVSHEDHEPLASMDAFDETIRPQLAERLLSRFSRTVAGAAGSFVVGHRSAVYEMTEDEGFLLGATPRPGLFVAAGGSGHGYKFGPLIGDQLASLIQGGAAPFVTAPQFALDRPMLPGRALI